MRSFKRDEYEADYLGLYFAARAGYDVTKAPDLWRRWGAERPASISGRASFAHGSSAERAVRLRHAAGEIEAKRLRAAPLVPDGLR